MNPETNLRLENLRAWCKRHGDVGPADLALKLDKKVQYVSDLLRGKKSFGEKAARHIEAKLGMGRGDLDKGATKIPHNLGELNGFEGQLITLFRQLSHDEQQHVLTEVNDMIVAHGPATKSVANPFPNARIPRTPKAKT
jgi:hypothetical protein